MVKAAVRPNLFIAMFRIWIDEPFLDSAQPLIEGVAELVGPGASMADLATCDAALVPGSRIWDAALMDQAPRMKVISRLGVGYDNMQVPEATARKIVACYAPEAPTVSTAEHALSLMMTVTKKIREADIAVRANRWKEFANDANSKGMELEGRTFGLVGMGRIGSRVARVAAALGMRVVVFDPYITTERAAEMNLELALSLESLLSQSDVVSLHVPVTPETRGLMNAERFAQMKPGAVLINTARGALVDEAALVNALKSGHLAGAGIDVYQQEPIPADHPLKQFENVVLTGHIASHTLAGHHRLYEHAIVQALQVLQGERPRFLLNPEVWDTRR